MREAYERGISPTNCPVHRSSPTVQDFSFLGGLVLTEKREVGLAQQWGKWVGAVFRWVPGHVLHWSIYHPRRRGDTAGITGSTGGTTCCRWTSWSRLSSEESPSKSSSSCSSSVFSQSSGINRPACGSSPESPDISLTSLDALATWWALVCSLLFRLGAAWDCTRLFCIPDRVKERERKKGRELGVQSVTILFVVGFVSGLEYLSHDALLMMMKHSWNSCVHL